MPLTTVGRNWIAQAIINDSAPTHFDNSNAYLGSGNSNTAFDAAQTDLQGGSKLRRGMEATYPQRTDNVISFRSLFGTGDANWAWNEWCVANHATAGVMLSRKVESLGTKAATQSWLLDVTLTVQIGS